MVECLDENVGRLLAALDELGLAENTMVVFSSDNGGIRQAFQTGPLAGRKGILFRGGIRVPLTVRWPGWWSLGPPARKRSPDWIFIPHFWKQSDRKPTRKKKWMGPAWFPCLLKKRSLIRGVVSTGTSRFTCKIMGEEDQSRDAKFRTRPGSVIRKGKWKLHEYFEDGALLLFDLEKDPGETTNLAAAKPKKLAELKKDLYAWRKRVNAPVPTKRNPRYVASPIKTR